MALPLAVVVSGGGSNLQSIIDRVEQGVLDVDIKLVLSNNPDAYGLVRAKEHGIATWAKSHKDFSTREGFDDAMVEAIGRHGADSVALAGFMRLLTPRFLGAFPGRVINIHPAVLPSFPGTHGQRDAARYGVKISGCTVHFVDEIMDHGPVIIQAAVPVVPGESAEELGARILTMEHRIFPQAIQWFAQDRLTVDGRHVHLEGYGEYEQVKVDGVLISPALEKGF